MLFGGIRSPRRARSKISSTRSPRRRNATSAAPRSTVGDSVVATRRVRDALEAVPVDEVDIELVLATAHELDALASIRDHGRPFVGLFAETEQRLVEVAAGLSLTQLLEIRPVGEDAVRREHMQSGVVLRHHESHDPNSALTGFGAELDGALVAMVPVGDEELSRVG